MLRFIGVRGRQENEIQELEEYVQSVDLIDVTDDPSGSTQSQPQPEPADGQQCNQCDESRVDGRVDPSDGAHATCLVPTIGAASSTIRICEFVRAADRQTFT